MQKDGIPRPFLPTREDILLYRKRWTSGTKRFTSSSLARNALDPGQGTAWNQKNVQIPARDGYLIKARQYIPQRSSQTCLPLLVLFHGGGYCLGGLDTDEFICQLLCYRLKIVVLNVDYRLSPEHPFPTGFNDTYDSVKWVSHFYQSPSEVIC